MSAYCKVLYCTVQYSSNNNNDSDSYSYSNDNDNGIQHTYWLSIWRARCASSISHYSWMVTIFSVLIQECGMHSWIKRAETWILAAHFCSCCSQSLRLPQVPIAIFWINVIFYIYKNNKHTNRNIWVSLGCFSFSNADNKWARKRENEQQVRSDCQINWVIRILLLLIIILFFFYILSS